MEYNISLQSPFKLYNLQGQFLNTIVGPIFLDRAKKANESPEMIEYGEQILTIAVMSILITAPLGAIGILGLGPHLLDTDKPEELAAAAAAAGATPVATTDPEDPEGIESVRILGKKETLELNGTIEHE